MTDRPSVAHLVTPYLFLTGSWIHSQLGHNPRYRAVVMTQASENLSIFPFEPVHDFSRGRGMAGRLRFAVAKYLLGRFPAGPYIEAAHRERVVLLHAHQGWEGARTIHLRGALGVPLITSFYGRDASMLPRKRYWRTLYRRLFAEGDLFLAEGSHMARTLASIGCPSDRIRTVHLGVDLSRIPLRPPRLRPDSEFIGLIAASFREKKGIPMALEAAARLLPRWPGLRLRLVGDGPLRPVIEGRIRRSDLAGKVEIVGYCDFPAYLRELGRADFLLAPSFTASDGDCEGGAPVCLLDAQAAGLPIVATLHCDIPEVTRPGRSALLSPEKDIDALAANIEELISHPERWESMGREGRAHVEAEYDISRQAARMADTYDDLLGQPGRSRPGGH